MRFTFLRAMISCVMIVLSLHLSAHNGAVAYAQPIGPITVDGDVSDWPRTINRYPIATWISDTQPESAQDFSAEFMVGYRLEERSLYVAITVTDDDFIEDTTDQVAWNTQDGLEFYLDVPHVPMQSGVASFMYSKKLRNTNFAAYDAFAGKASWDLIEVRMRREGNQRFYEWKILLNEWLIPGKTIGMDMMLFDKDADGSFAFAGWGKGGWKHTLPGSLGDVYLGSENQPIGTVNGTISWDRTIEASLPESVWITDIANPASWFAASVDSVGRYAINIPTGDYRISLSERYFFRDEKVYQSDPDKTISVSVNAGKVTTASPIVLVGVPVPDLLPETGILFDFDKNRAAQLDTFIETYRRYYTIPGVSLALLKDGKVIYHKTYGVKNMYTQEPVDDHTLFEAASITKPVFSYAVLRLAERGIIDLDKPLYLYLPYPDIAYDERYKLMTARHVLTHRTGFPNWRYMNEDGKLDLKFTPGTDYGYSGEGFEYLKLVIEKITGKNVEQVLKEEVLDPLGLYNTCFSKNDSLEYMAAQGHFGSIPSPNNLPESPGMAYSMYTEANAFTIFMRQLLEQKGLRPETYKMMLEKQSEFKLDPGQEPPYPIYMGISLEIHESPFGKSFGHGGNNGDFLSHFEVYKDLGMGYAIFTNASTSDVLLESMRMLLVEGKHE